MKHIPTFEKFLNEGPEYYKGISQSTADKKKAQMAKQASMDDDDPAAYKELPGDTKGKKNLKPSMHTKKYHDKFKESSDYVTRQTGSDSTIQSAEILRTLDQIDVIMANVDKSIFEEE
jgi:hypothetical protein